MGITVVAKGSYLSEIIKADPSMVSTEKVYNDSRLGLLKSFTSNQTVSYLLTVKKEHKKIIGPNFVLVVFGKEQGKIFKLLHDDYHARLLGMEDQVLFTSRSFDPDEFGTYLMDFSDYCKREGENNES